MPDHADCAEAERAGWSQPERVAAYAALFAPVSDQVIPALVARSGAGPGRRVLDLCCGHGNATEAFLAIGAAVTGLDFSPAMLEAAARRAPGATLVEGDAQAMPFADARFDIVACNVGLGHVPDQPRAVAEIARVLAPGGTAVLSSRVEPEGSPAYQVIFGALKAHGDRLEAIPPAPDFHLLARAEEAVPLLTGAGLAEVGFTEVDVAFVLDRPEAFAEGFRRASVRAGLVIAAQGAAAQDAIWRAMHDQLAERHADGAGRWRVPFPAVVAGAVRP